MASSDQFQTFTDGMKGYFNDLNGHLSSGGDMPMFMDVVKDFDYSDILNDSISVSKKSVTPIAGAMVDSVHNISAVIREYGIRTKTRYDYFTDAIADTEAEANYYDSLSATVGTLLTGRNTDAK